LVVIGRSINIHKHLSMIQEAVGWENARYEEAYSGGQFGIKIEVTSEGIAAAAALHFQRPVRYIPSLTESMLLTPKRHPFDMSVKLGADSEGRLTALWMDFTVDNGAYLSIGQAPVNRALMMLSNSYRIPNVHALGRLVYTNNPWGAAARGAGPPQATFALECAMDMLADKLGIDRLEFRLRNSLRPGESKSTGAVAHQWPFPELCEAIRPHYERSVREARAHKSGPIRRGVGLAAGSFGIGQSGDSAIVSVELDPDDGITIYGAVADPGEGNDSMLTQLAAEYMGLPLDKIRLETRNSDLTTATGPAAGSRITYQVRDDGVGCQQPRTTQGSGAQHPLRREEEDPRAGRD
jgi:aldehyde oxidoreductase